MADEKASAVVGGMLFNIFYEIISSPINIILVVIISVLLVKIIIVRHTVSVETVSEPQLQKLKRDFTVEELRQYDGRSTELQNRILVAVNGKIFDVTKGKRFYGPGGPYSAYGGRDASRGLATFSVATFKDEYDDLSDLKTEEMESVREWEMQFTEKYDYVGRLLKPGEEPTNYSYEEEDSAQPDTEVEDKSKND